MSRKISKILNFPFTKSTVAIKWGVKYIDRQLDPPDCRLMGLSDSRSIMDVNENSDEMRLSPQTKWLMWCTRTVHHDVTVRNIVLVPVRDLTAVK